MERNQTLFEQALRTKTLYRKVARELSWEEKVASIGRMMEVAKEMRKSVTQAESRSRKG